MSEKSPEGPKFPGTPRPVRYWNEDRVKAVNNHLKLSADSNLSLIGYPSLLLSALLKRAAKNKQIRLALVYLVSRLKVSPVLADPGRLGSRLRTLYGFTSDIRTFVRVWGSLDYVEWAFSSFKPNVHEDEIAKWVDYIQLVACILYQALENVAYVGSHGIIAMSPRVEARLWAISCMWWALYVQLDFIKLFRRKDKGSKQWLRDFAVNCCYVPLSIHWSTETGFLSDGVVGLLGTFTAFSGAFPRWTALLK